MEEALQFEAKTTVWKEVLNTLSEFEQDRVSDRYSGPCGSGC